MKPDTPESDIQQDLKKRARRRLLGAAFFVIVVAAVLPLVMGEPTPDLPPTEYRDRILAVGPPLFMMLVILLLGVWPPEFLLQMLRDGAALLEVRP